MLWVYIIIIIIIKNNILFVINPSFETIKSCLTWLASVLPDLKSLRSSNYAYIIPGRNRGGFE